MNPTARPVLDLEVRRADRLMVLAPHPDDESLATGGILRRASALGARARILFVTDGENNPWAQRAVEGRWRIRAADRERWGMRRRAEALAAISCLGMTPESVRFLGHPDQGVCDLLMNSPDRLLRELVAEIAAWKPTILVDPVPDDRHPDHGALAVFTDLALAQPALSAVRPIRLRYALHGELRGAQGRSTRSLHLTKPELDRKRNAIRMHGSQLRFGARRVLRFAQPEERFLPATRATGAVDEHEIRKCWLDHGVLQLEIEPRRAGIGPLTVRVVLVTECGSTIRVEIGVPSRSGEARVRILSAGDTASSVPAAKAGNTRRLALPLVTTSPPAIAYVRLVRPAERRLGFFDEQGWRAISVARASRRGSAEDAEPGTVAVERQESPVT